MNMHAKFQIIFKHRYLLTINLVSKFLEFCTKSGSRGFIQNLVCKIWTFLQVSTDF
jgi:hypothetical protein